MNNFKGRHFEDQVILWAVRLYCKYEVSYRELKEMLEERSRHVATRLGARLQTTG